MSYLVGVGLRWTRGSWCRFLDDSPRDHLPFLGQDTGATLAEVCLRLEAD